MHPFNLYIMNISHAGHTSGVDRYVSTLLCGLKNYPHIHVTWILLFKDKDMLFLKEEKNEYYMKVTIPVPQQYDIILAEQYWMQKYLRQVYRLIKHLFNNEENNILHIQTLNLIELAIFIRKQIGCKIVTHLHCIPWKTLYDTDKDRFNQLYSIIYIDSNQNKNLSDIFIVNSCELLAYQISDVLVCVTRCAENFLKMHIQNIINDIVIVPNGMNDFNEKQIQRSNKTDKDIFRCLYVGSICESKGVYYILEALTKVKQKGYDISLTMVGDYTYMFMEKIFREYPDIAVNLLGRVSFGELENYYRECDIGIIASLQEQASYVAIEMAMFGMPIIVTAVDGLNETFIDGINALKVQTKYSAVLGLSVDVEMMAIQIIRMITDHELRGQLSKNARKLYEAKLSLELMMKRVIHIYENLNTI